MTLSPHVESWYYMHQSQVDCILDEIVTFTESMSRENMWIDFGNSFIDNMIKYLYVTSSNQNRRPNYSKMTPQPKFDD